MKIFSVVGTGNYQKTTYKYGDQECETNFFPIACNHFFQNAEHYLLMTKESKDKHLKSLKDSKLNFVDIEIPTGSNETEMWEMFNIIVDKVDENDEIVFDITHGFRTQPLLFIAVMIYLKNLKNVKIKNILYGAFEAKNESNISPVFDLKPFLDIIEWSNAVGDFLNFGDMKSFTRLLENIRGRDKQLSPLHRLASDFTDLSNAVSLLRLEQISQKSESILNNIKILEPELKKRNNSKPFIYMLGNIEKKLKDFLLPSNPSNKDRIITQMKIINWYLETNDLQQAISLAREILISFLLYKKNPQCDLNNKGERKNIVDEINDRIQAQRDNKSITLELNEFEKIWISIVDLRNIIDHAKQGNITVNAVRGKCREVIQHIETNI